MVTEHTIHRDWCPCCKRWWSRGPRRFAGRPDRQPRGRPPSWLHSGLGNTLSQIVEVFNQHLHFRVTPGGLVQQWYRLQTILFPWYEQLQQEALNSAVLHADETVRCQRPCGSSRSAQTRCGGWCCQDRPGNGCWRRVRKRLGRRGGWRANDLDAVADVPRDDVPHTFLCSADQVAAPIRDVYAAELIGGCGGARGVRADVAAGDDIGVAADRDSIAGESLNVRP